MGGCSGEGPREEKDSWGMHSLSSDASRSCTHRCGRAAWALGGRCPDWRRRRESWMG